MATDIGAVAGIAVTRYARGQQDGGGAGYQLTVENEYGFVKLSPAELAELAALLLVALGRWSESENIEMRVKMRELVGVVVYHHHLPYQAGQQISAYLVAAKTAAEKAGEGR